MSNFVLVDCNNFYVSCERVFNPQLEARPVIVLSNNDGCVIARSQEAKQLKIAMGAPYFQIKDLCRIHNVAIYSSNYQVYGDISQRVMHILSEMAPDIQIYSIDEAFLTYPISMPQKTLLEQCVEMKRIVKKWVGIPTSIGIAPSKTLAKVANDLAKKDRIHGVFDLSSKELQNEILHKYPIEDVWGIGRGSQSKLNSLGIYTAGELRDADPMLIRRKLGVVGERILWELRGTSCLPLEEASPRKSISSSRSFGKTLTEFSDLSEALAAYINTACLKLRGQKSCAQAMTVYLEEMLDKQTGVRRHASTTLSFETPTNDTSMMIQLAKQCLSHLFCKGNLYKKCGIILLDLIPEKSVLPDLFLSPHNPKREKVMQTIDALNARFGKNTLFYGAMGINPKWKTRCERRSPHYTTDWNDLAIVKTGC